MIIELNKIWKRNYFKFYGADSQTEPETTADTLKINSSKVKKENAKPNDKLLIT